MKKLFLAIVTGSVLIMMSCDQPAESKKPENLIIGDWTDSVGTATLRFNADSTYIDIYEGTENRGKWVMKNDSIMLDYVGYFEKIWTLNDKQLVFGNEPYKFTYKRKAIQNK